MAQVDKKALCKIRDQLKEMIVTLNTILDDEHGCPHANTQDISTMTGDNIKKFFCFDCGKSYVQEIEYEEI